MNLYKEYKEKWQNELGKLPIHFAFGTQQKDKKLKELGLTDDETLSSKIVMLGGTAAFMKKEEFHLYEAFTQKQDKIFKEHLKNDNFVKHMFGYELNNHEYIISRNDKEVFSACGLKKDDMKNKRFEKLFKTAKKDYLNKCNEMEL